MCSTPPDPLGEGVHHDVGALVLGVDKNRLDAEAGENGLELGVGAAIEVVGRDDLVALLREGDDRWKSRAFRRNPAEGGAQAPWNRRFQALSLTDPDRSATQMNQLTLPEGLRRKSRRMVGLRSHLSISVLMLGFLPAGALATNGTLPGAGTGADPYLVSDYADLAVVSTGTYPASATYRLVADLDASPSDTAHADSGLAPIHLTGTFHGGGHAIAQLSIHRPGQDAGLFGLLESSAVVDSLGLVGVSITGSHNVGGLAAINQGGSIQVCYSLGFITGDTATSHVGGLAGTNSGTIVSSRSSAIDSGDSGICAGGLVGSNTGSIRSSYATGTVNAGRLAGGLVGSNGGTLDSSWATGAVSAANPNARFGGLAGMSSAGRIHDCYATGAVTAYGDSVDLGGLVGLGSGGFVDSCYATGGVTANADHAIAGGLVGKADNEVVRASHAIGAVTTTGMNSAAGGLVGVAIDDSLGSCYATGEVTATGGNAMVGGLVGRSDSTVIAVGYAIGGVTTTGTNVLAGGLVGKAGTGDTVRFCYASGPVTATGTNAFAGGLVGLNLGLIDASYAISKVVNSESSFLPGGLVGNDSTTIRASYWGLESASSTVGVGYGLFGDSAIGLIAVDMKISASFAGWDFANTWILTGADSVPRLRALEAGYIAPVSIESQVQRRLAQYHWTTNGKRLTISAPDHAFQVVMMDLSGRVLERTSGSGNASMDLPSSQAVAVTFHTSNGTQSFVVPSAR